MSVLKDNTQDVDLWDLLTEKQREELDIAIKESENENNWISNEKVMSDSGKWLKK